MRTRFFRAAMAAIPFIFAEAAAAQPGFDAIERADLPACAEGGAWVRDAAVFTYFKDGYYDLDKRFRAFSGTAGSRISAAAATADNEARAESFAFLHSQVAGLIPRLGRLLPRVERPLDLASMAEQLRKGEIRNPRGDHHTEYLRVAFAREMLNAPASVAKNPGSSLAGFLDSLAVVENQLLALKNGGDEDAEALRRNLQGLSANYRDGFRPIAKHVIFASYANSLQGRLAFGVKEICDAQAMCANADADENLCGEGGDEGEKVGGGAHD
ncbi:MAG: hypothetical protein RIE56_09825 [Amphiplicatus sp.]